MNETSQEPGSWPGMFGWGGSKLGAVGNSTFPSVLWVLSFWYGPGRRKKQRADISLFIWIEMWPFGLPVSYSISFSMVLMWTVVDPTWQLIGDLCPSNNLVYERSLERFDRKF